MVLNFDFYSDQFDDPGMCCGCECAVLHGVVEALDDKKWFWARRKLISLPGGEAFAALDKKLGPELKTIWLGRDANCHPTLSAENGARDHPFSVEHCPLSKDKDCWQCLYILTANDLLKQGFTLIAATTNIYKPLWVGAFKAGSSELPSEKFKRPKPEGWGLASAGFHVHHGIPLPREAPIHVDTGEPLGLGCRWERRFLDSLDDEVYVVAKPPLRSTDKTIVFSALASFLCAVAFLSLAVTQHASRWVVILAICGGIVSCCTCCGLARTTRETFHPSTTYDEDIPDECVSLCECDALTRAQEKGWRSSPAYKERGKLFKERVKVGTEPAGNAKWFSWLASP